MTVQATAPLVERKNLIFTNVDRLMKCCFARYQRIDGDKTIYCELYVKNRHTGREQVVGTGVAHAIFTEMQNIPKAERMAYDRAYKAAGDFFSSMAIFLHLAGDHANGTDCDNINYQNLVVNTSKG